MFDLGAVALHRRVVVSTSSVAPCLRSSVATAALQSQVGFTESVCSSDDPSELKLVDAALYDLAFGGGTLGRVNFVRQLPPNSRRSVLIRSLAAEDRELELPDLSSSQSVEQFVTAIQEHVAGIYDDMVPACPVDGHDHALTCRVLNGTASWVCTKGQWSCPVGKYNERSWPPREFDNLQTSVSNLLIDAEIGEQLQIHSEDRDGKWTVVIGVSNLSEELTARLQEIVSPVAVQIFALRGQWRIT
jgi:hypothetical protein